MGSISPRCGQPVAQVLGHFKLLDRLLDRTLRVRSINDADELGRRAADVWIAQEWLCCLVGRLGIARVQ